MHKVILHSLRPLFSSSTLQRTRLLATAIGLICTGGQSAYAAIDFVPHVNGNYEYNSNIFLLSEESETQKDPKGVATREDTYWNYGGGLNIIGSWGEYKLSLNTDIRHYSYEHFTQLDRDDKLFTLALDWVATSKISGKTSARYDEHITPFTEVDVNGLAANTTISAVTFSEIDRNTTTSVIYKIANKWQLNLEGGYGRKTVPNRGLNNTGEASYDLQQIPRKFGIRYGGASALSIGASLDINNGRYFRTVNAPGFTIQQYQGQLDYTFSERTSLSSTFGRSNYKQSGLGSSANTGSLSFNQALTGKTRYYLRYDKSYSAYPLTGGAQLSDTSSAGLTWQALRKLSISGSYGITKAEVTDGVLGPGAFSAAHTDKLHSTNASITYDMSRWITIAPYYSAQKRTSNVERFSFNNHIYGASLTLRFQ